MQRESLILNFKPSQVASAALMFAINTINSKVKNKAVPRIAQKLQTFGLLITKSDDFSDFVSLWTSEIK